MVATTTRRSESMAKLSVKSRSMAKIKPAMKTVQAGLEEPAGAESVPASRPR